MSGLRRSIFLFLVLILLALAGGGIVAALAGENPLRVYAILFSGSFGSLEGFGYTLFYATPFIFAGLAVAIPYHAGLFNIGGEGQIYMGALMMTFISTLLPMTGGWAIPLLIFSAAVGGALWAALPALFKAYRGSHEVITTIMLNFIAMSFSNYCILYLWKDQSIPRPETSELPHSAWLWQWPMGGSPLNFSFAIAVVAALMMAWILKRTDWGFRLRASGLNPMASRIAGLSTKSAIITSMMVGGALASGVAVNEILGNAHRLRDGFSQGYGFIGIAVAFLGRLHPLGILVSAVFFGALYRGASELDLETTTMTRDFAVVLQAILIAAVASESLIKRFFQKYFFKAGGL
jgi:simple sugar transport system permease protein